jgi:beta-mannosidase
MVWQDFMFAGALYPADSAFLKNVDEEVRYQVKRLRNHPCIALWCGNNEIEEAWFNWGWQKQYNYSVEDSTKLWNDYKKIFHQLIPGIVKELDPQRAYWPSSPSLGWGREDAYKKGDVHYWGVWWGNERVEKYNEKVGRFNSEYGMQGMPDMKTIKQFSLPQDWDTSSAVMKAHQKHPFGYQNIKMYIENKFRTPKTFEDLVYVSQLMQADAIKTAIEAHRRNKPTTMGTMFWQWNDCWPVTSWSAVDYYGRKKAMFYEVKRSYQNLSVIPYVDSNYYWIKIISYLNTSITIKMETDFINFNDTLKNVLKSQEIYEIKPNGTFTAKSRRDLFKEHPLDGCMRFRIVKDDKTISENILLLADPKKLKLSKPIIKYLVTNNTIELSSNKFAYGVFIDVPDGVELEDNYFHLLPNEKKIVKFTSIIPIETIKKNINIKSLIDTY